MEEYEARMAVLFLCSSKISFTLKPSADPYSLFLRNLSHRIFNFPRKSDHLFQNLTSTPKIHHHIKLGSKRKSSSANSKMKRTQTKATTITGRGTIRGDWPREWKEATENHRRRRRDVSVFALIVEGCFPFLFLRIFDTSSHIRHKMERVHSNSRRNFHALFANSPQPTWTPTAGAF